ncbi:hypothetical protein CWI42_020360 [Ordospora colligata]|uniref:MHD domain-containing protein n=1 Tax=Ordospora colligata OC4 TaxID=1354746 RepID=A0A0B2ULJ1_9MICR|nr:uncharacterized protein M896_020370 [Ordospora colligata OC4]KHN70203.1 hypothetical protein M896_020370 [Ordospora colligata OC4]TBU16747.1 hypothetical protein CWI41_020380 [Ordospora colligata]TBU17053.1 hypothetical protein CWI40_020380 [Ordospora colligata]TBU19477.1 hypothetical protein CWI42_020360 [Ordospora colligata]
MIEEIFIVRHDGKILYGDTGKYFGSIGDVVSEDEGAQLLRVRMNDVVVGVLYKSMSGISALKYLERLRIRLERSIGMICEKNVLGNYFQLFRIISKPEKEVRDGRGKHFFAGISNYNGYLDVFERHNAIVDRDRIVMNKAEGSVYLKTVFGEERMIKIAIDKLDAQTIEYKSNEVIHNEVNGIKIEIKSSGIESEVFRYYAVRNMRPLVIVYEEEGGYVVKCSKPTKFDELVVFLPVPREALKVVHRHKAGSSVYDEVNNVVRWDLSGVVVMSEKIEYYAEGFGVREDMRSIRVHFMAKDWNDCMVKIESAECVEHPMNFWIRYAVVSGKYEMRVDMNKTKGKTDKACVGIEPTPTDYESVVLPLN